MPECHISVVLALYVRFSAFQNNSPHVQLASKNEISWIQNFTQKNLVGLQFIFASYVINRQIRIFLIGQSRNLPTNENRTFWKNRNL
jgi:hypothetical protein